jgi:hypothetical protein
MSYASPIQDLLREDRLPALGPGEPAQGFRAALQALTIENAFAPAEVVHREFAQACLAGLWLYFDYLDESHRISQDLDTVEGSYWHGLMHRREPDFWNSKYWFRRVGRHPVFEGLAKEAAELAAEAKAAGAGVLSAAWDPFAFVDLCEKAEQGESPLALLCRKIQQREWQLLFDFCYRQAVQG